jgi:hypothetical protein
MKMKTKSGKSHWKCTIKKVSAKWGETINDDFRFVAFDGIAHMDKIVKSYMAHGIYFEYSNLVNLDEE